MQRKKKGRKVNGILVLDKPSGITSNFALQKVKKLFSAVKAGHTGSLDPLASGVLPICLGDATKVSHFLLDADKRYIATCQFGEVKTTGDAEGETVSKQTVPKLNEQILNTLLSQFEGDLEQVPPMYSALKHEGRPLYELARKGLDVERKARHITVYEIRLLAVYTDSIEIEVYCSKGTYIRTLCEDIGYALGCGAHLTALRRVASGPFSLQQSITLHELSDIYDHQLPVDEKNSFSEASVIAEGSELAEGSLVSEDNKWQAMDNRLYPTDQAILCFPRVDIDQRQNELIQQGQAIDVSLQQQSDYYRLYYNNILKAIAVKDSTERLTPKRLLFL